MVMVLRLGVYAWEILLCSSELSGWLPTILKATVGFDSDFGNGHLRGQGDGRFLVTAFSGGLGGYDLLSGSECFWSFFEYDV